MVTAASSLSYSSRAALMDAISRGFSYPGSDFYADLVSGEFVRSLQRECGIVDKPSSVAQALSEIEVGIGTIVKGRTRENLESEYIELFEHNHKQSPLHLYGGLYLQSEGGRLETLQRLTRIYRSYGLEMEEGSEYADHLTLVLEFLGFLYRQRAQLQNEDDASGLRQLQTDIRTTITELSWTKRLDEELVARNGHPFYLSLSKLLRAVLALQDP